MSSQGFNQNTAHYMSHYLIKTLGITQILNRFTGVKPEADLGFFFEDYDQYSESEKELAFKIIQALKLKTEKYVTADLNQKNNIQNRLQIYFCHNPVEINETYSARVLLQKPELKKKTWDFLQNQMQKFNT